MDLGKQKDFFLSSLRAKKKRQETLIDQEAVLL